MEKTDKKTGSSSMTLDKLAKLIVDEFGNVNERFEKIDERFEKIDERFGSLEAEVRTGFREMKTILERIDTRLAALELAVFGATSSEGGRLAADSILGRLDKLERTVFHK